MNTATQLTPEIRQAYSRYTLESGIRNSKVACILVVVLMPLGFLMDHFVYRAFQMELFWLRLMTSSVAALVFVALRQQGLSDRLYRVLCTGWYMAPAFFICWMIYVTEGVASSYYAGLNLVILAVSSVIQATLAESLLAISSILLLYVGACVLHAGPADWRMVANNGFFLFCTAAIVITGNFFYNRLRLREFALRYELDESRQKLEESNQKLMELDQVKSRFFANISHELRTPLTLLIAPLETLLQRFNLDPETRNLLGTMQANGMRLLKLINDLLDLVRLEHGRVDVKREPLALADFVKGLASAARQVADDKRLRLEIFVDPELGVVMADRDKLEKILLNLVFNALKFTPAGGRVELRADKVGSEMVLSVSDTGMGIAAKNLPYVFDRFWQADDSSKRKYQGVGIGLSLVKEFTEIQGGTASVESQEGKGTTFTVRLPYERAEPTTVAPEVEMPGPQRESNGGTVTSEEWLANLYRRAELFPALAPVQESVRPVETNRNGRLPTVLVADDEPDMLRFLKSQLRTEFQVIEAVDGQQAVEKACQFLPDMILLDMMMPEKDGLQACREIREHTSTHAIPIVMLTARADEGTKHAALAAGASDFLTKPFSTTELHIRIRNLIESHQYQCELTQKNEALQNTIDQLKETESQLVQSEKVASLGVMSAGIIHEINNPLNFATTGLFTLRNKAKYIAPEQQEDYREILKDVEDGIRRVKDIVSDMRIFSHPDTESRDQVEVTEVVAFALRFLNSAWKDRVTIVQKLDEHQTIWANKNMLVHVLTNLIQNSLDALKVKTFTGETPTIWIEGRMESGKSLLIVRDNGTGIDAKHLDKIFDPFFTTKDQGEGMGLGLSICYRIVNSFDGRINVRTEAGRFCEFTLEFPAKG
jgi:signal transduction histidine kinase